MDFGGPVWHSSVKTSALGVGFRLAERALLGVGDAALGEWREQGSREVVHLRRRLTDQERKRAGRGKLLEVRDIRGLPEERRRLETLSREAPHSRPFLGLEEA